MWIIRGLRKGVITTGYPKDRPSEEEVPEIGIPKPVKAGKGFCPNSAIEGVEVNPFKCVFCGRCERFGYKRSRDVEIAYVKRMIPFKRSLHVFPVDVGSCNACNVELENLSNPYYDFNRLGIFFTPTPRHADVMIVMGSPTERMVKPMLKAYEAIPEPKIVVALGTCACGGFIGDGVEKYLEVDVKIAGCPPPPIAIIHGLLKACGRWRD